MNCKGSGRMHSWPNRSTIPEFIWSNLEKLSQAEIQAESLSNANPQCFLHADWLDYYQSGAEWRMLLSKHWLIRYHKLFWTGSCVKPEADYSAQSTLQRSTCCETIRRLNHSTCAMTPYSRAFSRICNGCEIPQLHGFVLHIAWMHLDFLTVVFVLFISELFNAVVGSSGYIV
jgi:hypothetical protein